MTLAAAAEWDWAVGATVAVAVMHLAGDNRYPLDLYLTD